MLIEFINVLSSNYKNISLKDTMIVYNIFKINYLINKLMDEKVNQYIDKQKSPQKEICTILRKIILNTFPSIKEEIKWGVPYYGKIFYFVSLKTHVNLGFSIRNLNSDEINLLEGTGKTMRHIKIKNVEDINEKRIEKFLKMVM
ncbi:MAG: DUF1801 domain-containing protein, partial [Candidatus Lokiarchaeota archaeon]